MVVVSRRTVALLGWLSLLACERNQPLGDPVRPDDPRDAGPRADRPTPDALGADDGGARAPATCSPIALVPAPGTALPGPVYLANLANGQSIGTARAAGNNAALVIAEGRHRAAAQQLWQLVPGSDPAAWKLRSQVDGAACLRSDDALPASGITLRACAGAGDWQLLPLPRGAYRIQLRGQPLYIGVRDASPVEGRALVLSAVADAATAWTLRDSRYRASGVSDCADPPLDQLTFLVTHNAFHNSGEGATRLPVNPSRAAWEAP